MDKQILQLEDIVKQQIAAQERMLGLLARKIDAFRKADQSALVECCDLENQQLQTIGEMEKIRLLLVAELTQILSPKADKPLIMGELAERLPEPARSRLMVLRLQLREKLEAVQKESSITQSAAETLLKLMDVLEDNDDVQRVSTNFEVSDEIMARLSA